ncbi:mitochondrial ornithine carrier protein [Metarhizium acridum]|nr:mitochondrial ornithine carrier protein [Metarhizium acridum]
MSSTERSAACWANTSNRASRTSCPCDTQARWTVSAGFSVPRRPGPVGISVPLVGAAVETSSLFAFESAGREMLYASGLASRDDRLPALLATGAFAGALASFVLNPCRAGQVPDSSAHLGRLSPHGPLCVIRDVFRNKGLLGFWHDQMGTLIRETGGGAAWFGAKEAVTAMLYSRAQYAASPSQRGDNILRRPLPLWQQAVAGASAGVSYNLLFFPADQTPSSSGCRRGQ